MSKNFLESYENYLKKDFHYIYNNSSKEPSSKLIDMTNRNSNNMIINNNSINNNNNNNYTQKSKKLTKVSNKNKTNLALSTRDELYAQKYFKNNSIPVKVKHDHVKLPVIEDR
jgi:hypothetical protein